MFTPTKNGLGTILGTYFSSPVNVINYLAPLVQKGAKNTISITNKTFLSKGLLLPIDEKELSAIADIFTTADTEIDKLEKKLTLLKDQKKYLLNNLITGQIRTPVNMSTD